MRKLKGFFHSFLPDNYRLPTKKKKDDPDAPHKDLDFIDLHFNWPLIVGEKLAKATRPLKIFRQTLIIMTKHSQYAHHLIHMEDMIKEKIFNRYPRFKHKIKKLRFEQNEDFFKTQSFKTENMSSKGQYLEKKHKYHPLSPQFKQIQTQAADTFKDVEDEEVKASLEKLFTQIKIDLP